MNLTTSVQDSFKRFYLFCFIYTKSIVFDHNIYIYIYTENNRQQQQQSCDDRRDKPCIRCLSPFEARKMLHRYTFPVKNTCMKPKTEHQATANEQQQQQQQKQKQQQQHESYPASLLMNIMNYDNNRDSVENRISSPSIQQIMREYKQSSSTNTSAKQSQRFNDNHAVNLSPGHIISTPDSFLRLVYSTK